MSIKLNKELIAGKYKEQVIPNADTINKGIAKIATQEEINSGVDNSTIVTPLYLSTKQNKLTAGEGININNNIVTSSIKADKKTINYTIDNNIEALGTKSKNDIYKYDWIGTEEKYRLGIENKTIDPDWYCYIIDDEKDIDFSRYTNVDLDNLTDAGKQVIIDTAGGTGGTGNPDNKTITINPKEELQAIGVFEKNKNSVKYDWIGTLKEYEDNNIANLHPKWICYILDDFISSIDKEINLNNPYTLFDSKYTDAKLYNISWLISNGSFYSKVLYPKAYDALLIENNPDISIGTTTGTYTKRGLSVKKSDEVYTDYDFVINTTNETFRLPIKSYQAPMGGKAPVKNSGTPVRLIGATTGTFANLSAGVKANNNINSVVKGTNNWDFDEKLLLDSNNSGIEADLSKATNSKVYLYYYVGETIENANLINAGRIEEKLNGKANIDLSNCTVPYIKKSYINGTSGYNVYSNGYCEQWGTSNSLISQDGKLTISLLKKYKDIKYNIQITGKREKEAPGPYNGCLSTFGLATTTFIIINSDIDRFYPMWHTYGYLAEGEY